jgi:Eukaryotic porin
MCRLDENSTVKTRIDSNAILASSFSHNLSKYVRMTLCGEVDIKDWSADSHKFGIGLTFE